MTERRRPRLYDNTIRRVFGHVGTVTLARTVAPGVRKLTIRASAPAGGWRPGHEIELWVGDGLVRHYTVTAVGGLDLISIVADIAAGGPGSR